MRLRLRFDDLNLHFAPIAFELFREHHRNGRVTPLPHLGARVTQDDSVIGMNDDPRVDLGSVVRSMRYVGKGKLKPKYEGAADGGSTGQE